MGIGIADKLQNTHTGAARASRTARTARARCTARAACASCTCAAHLLTYSTYSPTYLGGLYLAESSLGNTQTFERYFLKIRNVLYFPLASWVCLNNEAARSLDRPEKFRL